MATQIKLKEIIPIIIILLLLIIINIKPVYTKGYKTGVITNLEYGGFLNKTWDGKIYTTIDKSNFKFTVKDTALIKTIDSAYQYNWKVKLDYDVVINNFIRYNGYSPNFITNCTVIDRDYKFIDTIVNIIIPIDSAKKLGIKI